MGKQPPTGYFYELFLDEEGKKISKSVGKGLTIDTWVHYAPLESLLYYLFQNPRQAKRLYWGVVPKSVDEYLADLQVYPNLPEQKQPDAAAWQIFNKGANVPQYELSINFSLINNLISAVGTDDVEVISEYLKRYDPAAEKYADILRDLIQKGMNYYRDFILPNKHFRTPTNEERVMLQQIQENLARHAGENEDDLQSIPFEVAKANNVAPGELFKMFYEVVLGQERGLVLALLCALSAKIALILLAEAIQRN